MYNAGHLTIFLFSFGSTPPQFAPEDDENIRAALAGKLLEEVKQKWRNSLGLLDETPSDIKNALIRLYSRHSQLRSQGYYIVKHLFLGFQNLLSLATFPSGWIGYRMESCNRLSLCQRRLSNLGLATYFPGSGYPLECSSFGVHRRDFLCPSCSNADGAVVYDAIAVGRLAERSRWKRT